MQADEFVKLYIMLFSFEVGEGLLEALQVLCKKKKSGLFSDLQFEVTVARKTKTSSEAKSGQGAMSEKPKAQ